MLLKNVKNVMTKRNVSIAKIVHSGITVLITVKCAWINYTFLLMCQMMLQKENMTVFIWLTFIHANILADTHLN